MINTIKIKSWDGKETLKIIISWVRERPRGQETEHQMNLPNSAFKNPPNSAPPPKGVKVLVFA